MTNLECMAYELFNQMSMDEMNIKELKNIIMLQQYPDKLPPVTSEYKYEASEITADKARFVTRSSNSQQLKNLLYKIMNCAEKGESRLHVFEPLSDLIYENLVERGFVIIIDKEIANRDYEFSIHWD